MCGWSGWYGVVWLVLLWQGDAALLAEVRARFDRYQADPSGDNGLAGDLIVPTFKYLLKNGEKSIHAFVSRCTTTVPRRLHWWPWCAAGVLVTYVSVFLCCSKLRTRSMERACVGGDLEYNQLLKVYDAVETNVEKKNVLLSLGSTASPDLKLRTMQWALDEVGR